MFLFLTFCRWEVDLKTVNLVGLLLYQAAVNGDFLGIELQDGKVRMLMNKGNGPTEIVHPKAINDGKWHRVIFDFNFNTSPYVSLIIDNQEKKLSLPYGNRYLDLSNLLYVGGTELSKRAKALGIGLKSGDVSYKGCLRNMMLDGRELGLPDVKISQGLVVNCVWGFPCTEYQPCVNNATCSQLGLRSFECTCDQRLCIKSNFSEHYKVKYTSALKNKF